MGIYRFLLCCRICIYIYTVPKRYCQRRISWFQRKWVQEPFAGSTAATRSCTCVNAFDGFSCIQFPTRYCPNNCKRPFKIISLQFYLTSDVYVCNKTHKNISWKTPLVLSQGVCSTSEWSNLWWNTYYPNTENLAYYFVLPSASCSWHPLQIHFVLAKSAVW